MCNLTAASYRHGTVIEAGFREAGLIPLNVSQARRVGRSIRDRLPDYMEACVAHIRAVLAQNGGPFGSSAADVSYDPEKSVSARFDPGLILDLPKITVKSSGRVIELRTCITVCVGPTKSKVWTRANTIGDWGDISESDLRHIHDAFAEVCHAINVDLIAKYQDDLSGVAKAPVELRSYGHIHVFAADCVGDGVSSNLEALCDRLRVQPTSVQCIDNPELAGAMRSVTRVTPIDTDGDATASSEFSLGLRAAFYPFRGSNGAGSVFVRVTDDTDAYFTGIVNGDDAVRPEDAVFPDGNANSIGTTAEVAAFFGGAF